MKRRAYDLLETAVLFGLLTGCVEVALRLVAARLGHDLQRSGGHDMLWMIPSSMVVIFAALALCVAAIEGLSGGRDRDRAAIAAFVALGAYALILLIPGIHGAARILLSVGIGVRASRALASERGGIKRLASHAVWLPLFLVVVIGGGYRIADAISERRSLARLPAAPANAPNVLLIILDTVRAADLTPYGYDRQTAPHLLRFSKSGVLFERAVATAPWTLPSHGTLFTGRYSHELTADWTVPLDPAHPTLAELLRDRGYATAGIVANTNYTRRRFGLDRGFVHYEYQYYSPMQILESSELGNEIELSTRKLRGKYRVVGRIDAAEVNRRFFDWLPSRGERPFFVFLNYFDAHAPYFPQPPYDLLFTEKEPITRDVRFSVRNSPDALRGMRDSYNGSIAYLDAQLGRLFEELTRRGLMSNTLIVITSDHGEEFGEHGWVGHGNGLHFPSLHVPLIVAFSGRIPSGARVAEPVTLRDMAATVADLVGIEVSPPIPGRSLALHWDKETAPDSDAASPILSGVTRPLRAADWYAVSKGPMSSIVVGRHHYIRAGDRREEFYDIVADPWETVDLAGKMEMKAILDSARRKLDSALRTGRQRPSRR